MTASGVAWVCFLKTSRNSTRASVCPTCPRNSGGHARSRPASPAPMRRARSTRSRPRRQRAPTVRIETWRCVTISRHAVAPRRRDSRRTADRMRCRGTAASACRTAEGSEGRTNRKEQMSPSGRALIMSVSVWIEDLLDPLPEEPCDPEGERKMTTRIRFARGLVQAEISHAVCCPTCLRNPRRPSRQSRPACGYQCDT